MPGVDSALLDPRSTWARPRGVRREGPRARRDVPQELRAVRRRRESRQRRPARLSCLSRAKTRLAKHIVWAIDFLPDICIECNFAGRLRTSKKQSSKTIKTPKKGARMLGLKKPSPALVIALLALFISLSGTAVAAGIVPLAKRALTADKAKVATKAKLADTARTTPRRSAGKPQRGSSLRRRGRPAPPAVPRVSCPSSRRPTRSSRAPVVRSCSPATPVRRSSPAAGPRPGMRSGSTRIR